MPHAPRVPPRPARRAPDAILRPPARRPAPRRPAPPRSAPHDPAAHPAAARRAAHPRGLARLLGALLILAGLLAAASPAAAQTSSDPSTETAALAAQRLATPTAARPSPDGGPTTLLATLIVVDLDAIDDANQSFDANVYLAVHWTDRRVAEGAPVASLWSPRLALANQQRVWTVLRETVHPRPDGEIRLNREVWGSFSQPLDLRRFPFDRQVLNVLMVTDVSPEEIRFVAHPERPSGINSVLSIPDWTVVGTQVSEAPYKVVEGIDAVAAFNLAVTVERRSRYHALTMILPLVVIMGMACLAFWMTPENGTSQVAVASTSMLTVVTYRVAAVQTLPRTAYFTDTDVFIAGCTLLVFSALITTVAIMLQMRADRVALAHRINLHGRWLFPALLVAILLGAYRQSL